MAVLAAVILLLLSAVLPAAAEPAAVTEETQTAETSPAGDPTQLTPEEEALQENRSFFEKAGGLLQDILDTVRNVLNPANWFRTIANWMLLNASEPILRLQSYFAAGSFTRFFGHAFIRESLDFFGWVAGLLLTCGFVMQLCHIVERAAHGETTPVADIVLPILRGYGMLLFCRPVILYLNELFWSLTDALSDITGAFPADVLGEWARDVLAGYITFGFQLVLYRVGMILLNDNLLVGIALLATTGAVPVILRRYGYANQTGSIGRYAGQAVNIGMSVARLVAV